MAVNLLRPPGPDRDPRLYLTEEALDRSVELFLAASRRFFRHAEPALAQSGLGAAHYRALSAIRRQPGITPTRLRGLLGVRKQSLARVLTELDKAGLVARAIGMQDRRERALSLTQAGADAEAGASAALRDRLAAAFRAAGADAVAGARSLLEDLAADREDEDEAEPDA